MKITPDLVKRTLSDNTDGFKFENFAQAFFSALLNQNYKPVGGIHDGGADGIFENDGLYEVVDKSTHFIQVSIEKQPKSKIKKTINRLREYGRTVKVLTYITSIVVQDIDATENEILDDYGIVVRVRDSLFIASNIQYSRQTEEAFKNNLLDTYDFLRQFGHSSISIPENNANAPFLYAFLQQELQNKTDRSSLVNSLTDSLIIWALEDTDPEQNILLTAEEIQEKILDSMPTARVFIKSTLLHRLKYLYKTKDANNKRMIQYWSDKRAYCLPYATRQEIVEKNIKDEELFVDVQNILHQKIEELSGDNFTSTNIKVLVKIAFRTLHITFENEGLEFVAFIQNPESIGSKPPVVYNIDIAFEELVFMGNHSEAKELIKSLMGYIFYQSCDESITLYLQKLSETYALLLSLKADGRIVDYFQNMSSKFLLYVGTDILVRCLSERCLDEPKKATTNMLKILGDADSILYLTEFVLDEVWNNLRTSDFEYQNHFAENDQFMKMEIAKESKKILIRAYYYSKLSAQRQKVDSWVSFVNQFCTYSDLHTLQGRDQLRRYLINQFNFEFVPNSEVANIIDTTVVNELTEKLEEVKKRKELAVNAATMVDLIFKKRKVNIESSNSNRFGFSTWWLTGEKTTLAFTRSLVKENLGYYIIRPEFLLHYISLIPSSRDIKETYKSVFPSIMGIKMAGRISQDEYHKLLKNLATAQQQEPGRLEVLIEDTINHIKSDFIREYDDYMDVEV